MSAKRNQSAMSSNEPDRGVIQSEELSPKRIKQMLEMTVDQVQSHLEKLLGFKSHFTSKDAALLDYYISAFCWAQQAGFSPPQVSFTMVLIQKLLQNIKEKQLGFVENWMELVEAVEDACLLPPAGPLLDLQQAMGVSDYVKDSLFQSYRMYQLLFSRPSEEQTLEIQRTVEVISSENVFCPLEEGMSADLLLELQTQEEMQLMAVQSEEEEQDLNPSISS